ncbi:MAG: hypothetical protein E6I22_09715, partial [Chloroflexi bacterium]
MALINRLEIRQRRGRRLALVASHLLTGLGFAQLHHRLAPGVAGQAALQHLELGGDPLIFFGRDRLGAKLLGARVQLIQKVTGAAHVSFRVVQPVQGFLPLVSQAADSGGLLDQLAPECRSGLDHIVDV